MRKLAVLALVLVVFTLTPASYTQQALGRVEGLVADQTGAAIPGAAVSLWSEAASSPKLLEKTTDDAGRFVFESLIPGRFQVRAELDGSRTAAVNVTVKSGKTAMVTVVLEIGTLTETIQIVGAAPALQTRSADSSRSRRRRKSVGNGHFSKWLREDNRIVEEYGLIEENRCRSVKQTPLSTFAADVDTASYRTRPN